MISLQRRCKKHHLNQVFSIRELTFEKIYPEVLFYVTLVRVFMFFGVLPDSNIRKILWTAGSLPYNNPTTAGQTSRLPCRLLIEITTLIYKRYEISVLQFADDTYLATLKKLDNSVDFLTFRHLLLNLVDSIEHAGLTMEHKTIGVGNMADDFF